MTTVVFPTPAQWQISAKQITTAKKIKKPKKPPSDEEDEDGENDVVSCRQWSSDRDRDDEEDSPDEGNKLPPARPPVAPDAKLGS